MHMAIHAKSSSVTQINQFSSTLPSHLRIPTPTTSMMKLTIITTLTSSAAAFVPFASMCMSSTGLYMSNETTVTTNSWLLLSPHPFSKKHP
mmetsp:Transcript_33098/g.71539  ORF Transcript_33098/g.71539 Transcript_33098/m.71539 type:complete len:91 (-) Transcript_33098:64-336(-)